MEYAFRVHFEGEKVFYVDATDGDEAHEKLAQELEWEVDGLSNFFVISDEITGLAEDEHFG